MEGGGSGAGHQQQTEEASRTKRNDECICKNGGGWTEEEKRMGYSSVMGLGSWSEILKSCIPLRILTFSSIDSKGVSERCKSKEPRDAAPQSRFERKFKFLERS
ncbi:hypothetical protein CEXT_653391 [Caerostris extrusa]|uniref:Uncharacterized protein n=1 Tax=Caerostris extrusa TaxID=172846 RepID=A0AAV4WC72_CAEEX|nr:hypothetical protein CEXT_653391 [Caerostris extrusa]